MIQAPAEVETATGSVVQVFTNGTTAQIFLVSRAIATESWSGNGSAPQF